MVIPDEPNGNAVPETEISETVRTSNQEGKRKLPLISQISEVSNSDAVQILESAENEETKILLKIAHAFLKGRYPLSPNGESLRERVQKLLENKDIEGLQAIKRELPTVEQPHLELFADLDLPPEELHKIMGPGLANIQVTKGCSHKCDFCAANAEGKVTFMPYAAILKIAIEKRKTEDELDQKIVDYCEKEGAEPEAGTSIKIPKYKELFNADDTAIEMELKNLYQNVFRGVVIFADKLSPEKETLLQGSKVIESLRKLAAILKDHNNNVIKTLTILIDQKSEIIALLEDISASKHSAEKETAKVLLEEMEALPEKIDDIELWINNDKIFGNYKGKQIDTYYDSDPFDYRDSSFLHEDGSPADFGDVVNALGSKSRKIEITTAGWSLKDKVAQKAAEKVAESNYISLIRISINSSEIDAKKDPTKYVTKMEGVIKTLRKTFYPPEPDNWEKRQSQTQILLFPDPGNLVYQKDVVQKIRQYCKEINVHHFIIEPTISDFSGPMETEEAKDTHHDVMSCMPGHHIWPDGTIAEQNLGIGYLVKKGPSTIYHDFGTPKGSRPTPTGKKIFHITK